MAVGAGNRKTKLKNEIKGTWITFSKSGYSATGKTEIWIVEGEDGEPIGTIKWYGVWRKYCFFPDKDTIYENVCLAEISQFLKELTEIHRQKQRRR